MNPLTLWKIIHQRLKEQETLGPYLQNCSNYGEGTLRLSHITLDVTDTGKSNGLPPGYYKGLFNLTINIWNKSPNPTEIMSLIGIVQQALIGEYEEYHISLDIRLQKTGVTLEKSPGPPLLRHGILEFEVLVQDILGGR